ncbi:ribonuclease H-like domain-containing protein [Tanacetum coccineum]
MWLFRHKYLPDGTLSRYKDRLMANGSTQFEGVDIDETFSSVVKLGTIRTVLSLADFRHWPIHQLDVKNAFLREDLSETAYMHQPPGFRTSMHPDYGIDTAYLLLYVDDIMLTAYSETLLQQILERAHMVNCNPSRTPVDTESKLGDDGNPVYLYMHDPREPHFLALERILRYIQGTLDHGLQLFASFTTSLVANSYADWAGCPITRRSTSGYSVFLGNNILSWSSKHRTTLSRSSAEAEYRGITNAVAETCWLRNLLHIFTKGLPSVLFEEFRSSLSVQCPPTPTVRECLPVLLVIHV